MTDAENGQQRIVEVVSTSTKRKQTSSSKLPTSLSRLRRILQKKSENNDEIDSNTLECIALIINQIQDLSQLTDSMKKFHFVHAVTRIYIADILSIEKAMNVLSNATFQQIFDSLHNLEFNLNLLELCGQNLAFAYTVFYDSLELLSLPIITDFLHNRYPTEIFAHIGFVVCVILARIQNAAMNIEFKKTDLENQKQNLSLLINYVDQNKENTDQDFIINAIDIILKLLWTLADQTILVPTLIVIDCPNYAVKWISTKDLSMDMYQAAMHIIHNIARHEQGADDLKTINCLSALKDFKEYKIDLNKDNQDPLYTELSLIYCMSLSYLIEPKENRENLNNVKKILDQLIQITIDAGQSQNNKAHGFHVSEPLVVLTKLFVHDDILKYVLNESPSVGLKANSKIAFFCHLLIKFRGALAGTNDLDQLTLTAIVNLIWSISFHDEYIEELKSTPKFLITVKSLANDDREAWVSQYVPKTMASIQKAANGILWNLDEDNPARVNKTVTKADVPKMAEATNRIRVMASYCHADSDFCHQLVGSLQKDNRFEVWVDFEYCHTEDLWEEIGEAIEKADVILFLMSKDYQDSKSCRQEVMYTKDSLKKRFIPIYTKKDFVATSWLGVRIVGPQYIRFGKKSFDETMNELIKLIVEDHQQEVIKETKPLTTPISNTENKPNETKSEEPKITENTTNQTKPIESNSTQSTMKAPRKPVTKWTKKDVIQWLESNHIQQELINLYDFQHGTDLLLYRQCLQSDWEREYNDMKQRYQQHYHSQLYRDQFVRFVGAMQRLEQSSSSHSERCVIS